MKAYYEVRLSVYLGETLEVTRLLEVEGATRAACAAALPSVIETYFTKHWGDMPECSPNWEWVTTGTDHLIGACDWVNAVDGTDCGFSAVCSLGEATFWMKWRN